MTGDGWVLTGIGALVTNRPDLGGGGWGMVPGGAVAVLGGRVAWAGRAADLPEAFAALPRRDAGGRSVLPGFVDAHTHLVFAGDRAAEFAARLEGRTYEDTLAAGGGIMATVRATRAATVEALVADSLARARRMLAAGTTTVEVKSGYGLEPATERRMLAAAARVGVESGIEVIPSFLGAHVVPPEWAADRAGYLRLVEEEMLPACAPLARFCDVFCDRGAFSVEEARRILTAASSHGLAPRLHAEQLAHTGAADLAVELRAASADHLDHVTGSQAARLAAAGVAAVLLPGAALSLRTPPPPARLLWEAGAVVALATDCNPGTSYVETMPFVIALGCLLLGLTIEEAVWGATRGGAIALRLPDRGWLGPGAAADLVVLDADHPAHLAYRPDGHLVAAVFKGGETAAGAL
jgi:imidazolonepropionase